MNDKYIAIIGMSGVFPEANNLEEFYLNLRNGKDSVRELSEERMHFSGMDTSINYMISGHLDRIDLFDHSFFNISKRDAGFINPTQRLLMELSVKAIENSGYSLETVAGGNVGVFIGASDNTDYKRLIEEGDPGVTIGNMASMEAGRLAYHLNLCGPVLTVDTACSSSLVAVNEACKSILADECSIAIVGAVKALPLFPEEDTNDSYGIIATDRKVKSFDDNASGTGIGEGGGVLFLKCYDDAIRDNDFIHGVILSTVINHDGARSNGLTAPSPLAQEELIRTAWKKSGVHADQITYIESHGTGTILGDPIEIQGITKAFKSYTQKKSFCAIGALKTNISHLGHASGIAGLIKAVISLKKKELFPVLHYTKPNVHIDFNNSAAYVNSKLQPWLCEEGLRHCGVSSFGLSGTNAHVILREENFVKQLEQEENLYILKISAKSTHILSEYIKGIYKFLGETESSISDICYTLNTGRSDYKFKRCVSASSQKELLGKIYELSVNDTSLFCPVEKTVIAIFSGSALPEGNHHYLYHNYTEYKIACDRVNEIAPIKDTLQLSIFISHYALFKLLESMGIQVRMIIATGIGRLVNDVILNKCSLQDAINSVYTTVFDPIDDIKLKKIVNDLTNNNEVVFVEVGIESFLTQKLVEIGNINSKIHITSFIDPLYQSDPILKMANFYNIGVKINWKELYRNKKKRKVEAPTYPFERISCWYKDFQSNHVFDWFYSTRWIQLKNDGLSNIEASTFLIFMDQLGLGEQVELHLKNLGKKVIKVVIGEKFRKVKDDSYEINVENENDYLELRNCISRIDGIIHLMHYDQSVKSPRSINIHYKFIRAFAAFFTIKDFNFSVVLSNSNNVLAEDPVNDPISYCLQALQKSLIVDYPTLNIRTIDFISNEMVEQQAESLIQEISNNDGVRFIAYRQSIRYIPEIYNLVINPNDSFEPYENVNGGTYLITGGATGIGLAICKRFAEMGASNLIIFGRTKIPDVKNPNLNEDILNRMNEIEQLKQSGVNVYYFPVDVGNKEELNGVFKIIKTKFEKLNGVIHCASPRLVYRPMYEFNDSILDEALKAKIYGTLLLDELTRDLSPDFFVLFSSLNAQVPRYNSSDYAVANAFLDSYAIKRKAEGSNFMSLAWPAWQDTDLSVPTTNSQFLKAISFKDGLLAFLYALNTDVAYLSIANINLSRFSINPYFEIYSADKQNGHRNSQSNKTIKNTGYEPVLVEDLSIEEIINGIWEKILKADNIQLTDDFFELGGHSLNGAQVLNRLKKILKVELEIDDIFIYRTIQKLSERVKEQLTYTSGAKQLNSLTHSLKKDYFELSHSQKRIWIMSQTEKGSIAYNIPSSYYINGLLDINILENAFKELIIRHETLRTSFITIAGEPKQIIGSTNNITFKIETKDLSSEADALEVSRNIIAAESEKVFNLEAGHLFKIVVMRIEKQKYLLFFNIHHIVFDGWSMPILFDEIMTFYQALSKKHPTSLLPLEYQYKDYAEWQHQRISDGILEKSKIYWQDKLSGVLPVLELKTDFLRPKNRTFDGDLIIVDVQSDLEKKVRNLSLETNSTPFILMLSAYKVLLFNHSSQQDLIVGTDLSGRITAETEQMIGMFVNTIALRSFPQPSMSFDQYLAEVKKIFFEALEHQEYQFDDIVTDIVKERDLSRNPIFDTMFVMQNHNSAQSQSSDAGFEMERVNEQKIMAQFDLSVVAIDNKNSLTYFFKFNSGLFKKSTMETLASQYHCVLELITDNPKITLMEINQALDTFTKSLIRKKQDRIKTRNIEMLKKIE